MLTAEPLIIARLKAQLPVTVPPARVASSASVAGSLDIAQHCPLVLVHPGRSDSVDQTLDDLILETQVWRIVVVVKNVPDTRTFAADYAAAGALLRSIVIALDGFNIGADFDALKFVARAEPEVGQGFSEFALEFKTKFTLHTTLATPTPDSFITFDQTYDLDTTQTGDPVAEDTVTLPQ